eukprot:scaffold45237_cov54-Phaeocystis_antarctica.AAC.1
MKPRCPSCCQVEDGKSSLGTAQSWWTLTARLEAFTSSSADALSLAQRCPGRRSSSGPKGEVRLVRLAELAVADSPKLPKRC